MRQGLFFLIFLLPCFWATSCSRADLVLNWDKVRDYHRLFFNVETQTASPGNVDFYLDFTVGINVAFRDANTKNFFDAVIRSMKIEAIDFYELSKNNIVLFENSTKDQIYAKLRNPLNFRESYAPIDEALNRIVEGNNFSILVTDGELWKEGQGELASTTPWAREGFARWLDKGNQINFYITDHIDAGKTKHLFYMIFIPKSATTGKLPSDDIDYFLKNDFEARSLVYSSFSFSNDFYKVKQNYPSAKSTGACEELAVDLESYINDSVLLLEYMDFTLDWKNIVKYIRNARDEDTGNVIPGGKNLIRSLYIDARNNELYNLEGVGLKVYDIYDDYVQFEFCEQCKAAPPVFQIDEKGNIQLDLNNNNMPIILQEGLQSCYDERGDLLPERRYSGPLVREVQEMFVLDENLFDYSFKKDTVGEIGIKVHPNFDGTQAYSDHDNFHRIDVVLTKCTPNTENPKFEKFIWEGKQIPKNKALYESIILALKDTNPEGKVLYSFYVKSQPNNYYE